MDISGGGHLALADDDDELGHNTTDGLNTENEVKLRFSLQVRILP